jgi:hypothetical protein
MQIDCPKGWKCIMRFGNITFEDHRVSICDGVCDSADLCGIAECEFYDLSEDATRRFLQAQVKEHSLEGVLHQESLRRKSKRAATSTKKLQ